MRTVAGGRIDDVVAVGAGKPGSAMTVGAVHDLHLVRQPGVELQRRVAGDVAVLAARMLQHLLYRGERGDRLGALVGDDLQRRRRRGRTRSASRTRSGAAAYAQTWPSPQVRRVSGSSRRRWPVSAATAFATAGAREMDARCEDQRPLRRHRSDQQADRRPQAAGLLEQAIEVTRIVLRPFAASCSSARSSARLS